VLRRGCYACTWSTAAQQLAGRYSLIDVPAGLDYQSGQLQVYSWANVGRPSVGDQPAPPESIKLLDPRQLPAQARGRDVVQPTCYAEGDNGMIYLALSGSMFSADLRSLPKIGEGFHFVEEQSVFALEAGGKMEVKYHAPGAAHYRLEMFYELPYEGDDSQTDIAADSTTGTFELDLQKDLERTTLKALEIVQAGGKDAESSFDDRLVAYGRRITEPFQKLAGRKPRGVLVPIYAQVIAEHENGEKAGLAHAYLIEVPVSQVRSAAQRQ